MCNFVVNQTQKTMAKDYENVKIETELLNKVRDLKEATGVSITAFLNRAVKKEIELYQRETKTKK